MSMSRFSCVPALGFAAAMAVVGCSSSTNSASSGASASASSSPSPVSTGHTACDVLTADVAISAIGPSAHPKPIGQMNPNVTQCEYANKNGTLTVMVGPWDDINAPFGAGNPLKGVGNEAYTNSLGLIARRGQSGIDVDAIPTPSSFWGKPGTDLDAAATATEVKVVKVLIKRI